MDQLLRNLDAIKDVVTVDKIPEFAMKIIRQKIPSAPESCLDAIEPVLLEKLYEYQREGVLYGISRGGRFLLGDDMGLGKTIQALAVADFWKEDWPLLIVTTATLREMWFDKIVELLPSVNVQDIRKIIVSNTPINDAKIVIISYSAIPNNLQRLVQKDFGVVVFDESHSIKNPKSLQTISSTKLGEKAHRVILLTGTPALSRPAELFSQLAIIDKKFSNLFQFTKRYCDGHQTEYGWKADGATNMNELNVVLHKRFMIRRTKDRVTALGLKIRERVDLKDLKLTTVDNNAMKGFSEEYFNNEGRKGAQHEILVVWYARTAALKSECVW